MAKNKKKKLILVALVICFAILITLIVFLNRETETSKIEKEHQEYEEAMEEFQEFKAEFFEETVLPRKMYELYNYEGKYENQDLFKSLKICIEYLDYLEQNVNLENSEEFFNQRSTDIKNNIGITSYEEFEKFITESKKYNLKSSDFKYAEFEAGSSYTENEYFIANMNFYYGEEEQKVTFKVHFAEKRSLPVKVKYEFSSNEN